MLAFKVRKPLDTCNERRLNLHCHINSWTSQIYDHYVSFASNILNSLQNWIANIDSRKMTLLIFEMKWVEDICVCSGLANQWGHPQKWRQALSESCTSDHLLLLEDGIKWQNDLLLYLLWSKSHVKNPKSQLMASKAIGMRF